jgi:hypothetical protein
MIEKLHSLYTDNNYVDSLMKEQKDDFGYHICTPKVYKKPPFRIVRREYCVLYKMYKTVYFTNSVHNKE